MNLIEAVKEACKEPTLLKALSWIAVWENDRCMRKTLPLWSVENGGPYETFFYICFKMVAEEWVKQGKL